MADPLRALYVDDELGLPDIGKPASIYEINPNQKQDITGRTFS